MLTARLEADCAATRWYVQQLFGVVAELGAPLYARNEL